MITRLFFYINVSSHFNFAGNVTTKLKRTIYTFYIFCTCKQEFIISFSKLKSIVFRHNFLICINPFLSLWNVSVNFIFIYDWINSVFIPQMLTTNKFHSESVAYTLFNILFMTGSTQRLTWSSWMSCGYAPGIWIAIFTISFCCGMLRNECLQPWKRVGEKIRK